MSNSKSSTANKKAVTIKVTKSAEIKKAEKANKAALAKAKKEKAESIAADKAVEQTSEHLKEAQKDFSELTKAVYGKTWRKERLIAFVEENHKDVKILEYSRRQIAFTISNTRVPKDGYFSVR